MPPVVGLLSEGIRSEEEEKEEEEWAIPLQLLPMSSYMLTEKTY
jgi:hypothetical protein